MIEKNDSRYRLRNMTHRGLKKKLHKMILIELFLIDIMQISLTDWIENSIADIGREVAPTDIFQQTLSNFFLKNARWPVMFFFTTEEVFLFWCCIKNLQFRSARLYLRAQPTFCLGRNWHVPIYSARKTLALLGKKKYYSLILIEINDSRHRPGNMTDRGLK